jgi:hypothetical protein
MDQQQPLPLFFNFMPATSQCYYKFQYICKVHGHKEIVGLVVAVHPLKVSVLIRLFLCWDDMKERIGAIFPQNISFSPKDSLHPPFYL